MIPITQLDNKSDFLEARGVLAALTTICPPAVSVAVAVVILDESRGLLGDLLSVAAARLFVGV